MDTLTYIISINLKQSMSIVCASDETQDVLTSYWEHHGHNVYMPTSTLSLLTLFFIFPTMMIVNVLMNSWWTKFLSKQAIVIVLQPLGQLKCTLKCLFNPKYPSSYVNRYFQSCPRPIINTSDQISLHSIKE